MNWEAISALSEAVGALGVVASLIYVALQIKNANVASQIDAKLRTVEMRVDFQNMLISNPELNTLMISGRKGLENLSQEEYLRFAGLALKTSWFFSAGFFMRRRNALSDADWHEFDVIVDYWVHSHGYREWWRKMGSGNFSGEFKEFIEKKIDEAQAQG